MTTWLPPARSGAVPWRGLVPLAVVMVLGALLAMWFSGPRRAIDLLDLETLTAEQIRRVATALLRHESATIRSRASAKLAAQGDVAVPVLHAIVVEDGDTDTRKAALDVLTVLDADKAVEAMAGLIEADAMPLRRLAVDAAVQLRHRGTVAVIKRALADDNDGVRLSAIGGCELKRVRSAVPVLQKAMDDPNINIRRHAARALRAITGKQYRARIE